jgi:alkylresorcinol/alkylpyrone synthase
VVEHALGLSDRELALSWESLARVGNLSSASVLLVLEDTMMNHRPVPGTIGLMLAMGPGFSSEMILLRW